MRQGEALNQDTKWGTKNFSNQKNNILMQYLEIQISAKNYHEKYKQIQQRRDQYY